MIEQDNQEEFNNLRKWNKFDENQRIAWISSFRTRVGTCKIVLEISSRVRTFIDISQGKISLGAMKTRIYDLFIAKRSENDVDVVETVHQLSA